MEDIEKKKLKKQKRMSNIQGPISGFEEAFEQFAKSSNRNVDIMSIKNEDMNMEINTAQVKTVMHKTVMSKYTFILHNFKGSNYDSINYCSVCFP